MRIFQPIVSGSLNVFSSPTASVIVKTLPSSSTITNVVLYDTASGKLFYTASSGIGGGSGVGVGFPFSGSAVITGSLLVSGSGIVITGSLSVTDTVNITGALYASDITYQSNQQLVSWNATTKRFHYMAGGDVVVFPYTGSAIFTSSIASLPVIRLEGNMAVTGTIGFASQSLAADLRGIYIGNEASTSFSSDYTIQFPSGTISNITHHKSALFEINDLSRPVIRLNTSTTDTYGPQIQFFRNRSTTAVQANQELGELRFHSAYTNSPQTRYGRSAQILVQAPYGSSERSTPARMIFSTTPSGSVTPVVRLQIEDNGNVGIGPFAVSTATASATLHVSGANMIFDIPSKANGYILQSDASGNATWANPFNISTARPTSIGTGSITASVGSNTGVFDLFTIQSGSSTGLTYSNEGKLTLTNASGSAAFPTIQSPTSFNIKANGVLRLQSDSNNSVLFSTNATDRWLVSGTGHLLSNQDNAYDIGAFGASRVRNLYVAGSGSFNGGLIVTGSLRVSGSLTGSLSGTATNATLATNATNVAVTNTTTGGSTRYITFVVGTSGNRAIEVDSTGLTYNNTTNVITATASFAQTVESIPGGTENYVALWNTATSLSRSIIYQNATSKLGIGTTVPDYLTHIRSTTGPQVLKVEGTGSANPIFLVEGSQGELFSVTDNISGSLFSVNDNSGLPILDVISDSTILMGNYSAPALNTTVKKYTLALTESLYTIPTGSYDAAFVEYYYSTGSYYGGGRFMTAWSGSTTENQTDQFSNGGDSPIIEGVITGSYVDIRVKTIYTNYLIKAIIRSI